MKLLVNNIPEIQCLCKSYGVKNYSRLQRKHIVDKNGHSRVVYVKPDDLKSNKYDKNKENNITLSQKGFSPEEIEILSEAYNDLKNSKTTEERNLLLLDYISGRKGNTDKYAKVGNKFRISLRNKYNELKAKTNGKVAEYIFELKESNITQDEINKTLAKINEVKKNIDSEGKSFTTVEECENYLISKDWFKPEDKLRIKLKGMDLKSAKYLINVYKNIMDIFPGMKGNIYPPVFTDSLEDNVYAACNVSQKIIKINKKFFTDSNVIRVKYANGVEAKFNPQNTTYEAIFYHELAHCIDQETSFLRSGIGAISDYVYQKEILSKNLDGFETFQLIRDNLSGYGDDNKPDEFFAEAFCEYFSSPRPRDMSKRVMNMAIRRFKELEVI